MPFAVPGRRWDLVFGMFYLGNDVGFVFSLGKALLNDDCRCCGMGMLILQCKHLRSVFRCATGSVFNPSNWYSMH